MKTATTRELRQEFSRILLLIEQGEEVEITRRGRVVARLTPPGRAAAGPERPDVPQKIKMPGFESSLKKLFGDE